MGYFDAIGKKISQTSQGVLQKTKDTAEVLKLNGLITDEQKRITTLYTEIGETYYKLHADSYEPDFQEKIAAIKDASAKIEAYSEQVKKLKGLVTCPHCGNSVPYGAPFCASCGSKMNIQFAGNVLRCANCGLPLSPGALFCTNCGTKTEITAPVQQHAAPVQQQPVTPAQPPVTPPPAPEQPPAPSVVTCPNCGKQVGAGMAFCTECGYHIGN